MPPLDPFLSFRILARLSDMLSMAVYDADDPMKPSSVLLLSLMVIPIFASLQYDWRVCFTELAAILVLPGLLH